MFWKKNIQMERIRKINMPSPDTIESRHAFHQTRNRQFGIVTLTSFPKEKIK